MGEGGAKPSLSPLSPLLELGEGLGVRAGFREVSSSVYRLAIIASVLIIASMISTFSGISKLRLFEVLWGKP